MSNEERGEVIIQLAQNVAVLGEKVETLTKRFDKMDEKMDKITVQQEQCAGASTLKKWIQEKFWIPILLLIIGWFATRFLNTFGQYMDAIAKGIKH